MGRGTASDRSPSDPTSPPANRTTIEIAARHRLKPYSQGLASTCGLLCIINALRLAMADIAPLTERDCKRLFAASVEYLQRKPGFDRVAVDGMKISRTRSLARHLAKLASTRNSQVVVEQPEHAAWSSIDDAFAWIELSLSEGKPVLIALMGGLNHFTVIAGATPTRLELFDSVGLRFVRKSSCGLESGYHSIAPKGLLRLAVKRPI